MAKRNGVLTIMGLLQWFLVAGASINLANAESIDVVVGLSAGYTLMEFPAKLDSEPTYPSYQLSGSTAYDQFYVSYSYADSFSDASISEEEDVGRANRSDQDLSIGYRLNESISLFIGYKNSETSVDFRLRDSSIVRGEYYRQDGMFVGIGYGYTFKNHSSLNISLAYVDLGTKNRFLADIDTDDDEDDDGQDQDGKQEAPEFDDLEGKVSGSADGFSININWIMPLSQSLAFMAGYKINDYEEIIKFEGERYAADTTITIFTIGLLKAF